MHQQSTVRFAHSFKAACAVAAAVGLAGCTLLLASPQAQASTQPPVVTEDGKIGSSIGYPSDGPIIDNIDASKEAYEALNRVDMEATREAGEMTASLIVLDAVENRDGDGSDVACAPSNPTAGATGNMSE